MESEYIDIFDDNNQATWKKAQKKEIHTLWLWHRSVQIWIYNKKWEILIQCRSKNKEFYHNKWDISVSWHIQSGEDVLFAAMRKSIEELWIELTLNDFELYTVYKNENHSKNFINNEFTYIYLVRYNKNIERDKINKSEIEEIKLININELSHDLKHNKVNYVEHDNIWENVINKIQENLSK